MTEKIVHIEKLFTSTEEWYILKIDHFKKVGSYFSSKKDLIGIVLLGMFLHLVMLWETMTVSFMLLSIQDVWAKKLGYLDQRITEPRSQERYRNLPRKVYVDIFNKLNPELSYVSSVKGSFPRGDSLTYYGWRFLSQAQRVVGKLQYKCSDL